MTGRSLVVGTLVGMVALFTWQAISNAVIPWHMATYHALTDSTAASVRALRAEAPTNGIWINPHGAMVVMSATPDYADQSKMMGKMLGRQAAIDLFAAAMLCILAARAREQRPVAIAAVSAFGALGASVVNELSNWNWYGFGIGWSVANVIDTTISFFIAGWIIAWIARRFSAPAPATAPVSGGYASPDAAARVG